MPPPKELVRIVSDGMSSIPPRDIPPPPPKFAPSKSPPSPPPKFVLSVLNDEPISDNLLKLVEYREEDDGEERAYCCSGRYVIQQICFRWMLRWK